MEQNTNISIQVTKEIVEQFIANADFPYLISFPRTGSHWLRMIMELYFEKPSLVRIFYYHDARDFTCYHRHDEELAIEHKNIIYLYRNPLDTVYSQLNYYRENFNDIDRIMYWTDLYGRHLNKWLLAETFSKKKTIVSYEGMKSDLANEFKKICDHFRVTFEPARLSSIAQQVSKEEVKRKTTHDQQVINRSEDYEANRKKFKIQNSTAIRGSIEKLIPESQRFFNWE